MIDNNIILVDGKINVSDNCNGPFLVLSSAPMIGDSTKVATETIILPPLIKTTESVSEQI